MTETAVKQQLRRRAKGAGSREELVVSLCAEGRERWGVEEWVRMQSDEVLERVLTDEAGRRRWPGHSPFPGRGGAQ